MFLAQTILGYSVSIKPSYSLTLEHQEPSCQKGNNLEQTFFQVLLSSHILISNTQQQQKVQVWQFERWAGSRSPGGRFNGTILYCK